jgi:hypothetical protein
MPAFLASRSAKSRAAFWNVERGKDAFPLVCAGPIHTLDRFSPAERQNYLTNAGYASI